MKETDQLKKLMEAVYTPVTEDNITDADYDIIVDGNTVKLTAGGHEVAVMSKQRWEAIIKHYKDPMASHNYKNHSGM